MITFENRVRAIQAAIVLPFGWEVTVDRTGGNWILRVGDPHGVDNTDASKPMPWRGRKWLLSEHMTDGEIVQTAFLATMTAMEHEVRELFTFQGQSVFDPHYDIHKLVALRALPDALKERDAA